MLKKIMNNFISISLMMYFIFATIGFALAQEISASPQNRKAGIPWETRHVTHSSMLQERFSFSGDNQRKESMRKSRFFIEPRDDVMPKVLVLNNHEKTKMTSPVEVFFNGKKYKTVEEYKEQRRVERLEEKKEKMTEAEFADEVVDEDQVRVDEYAQFESFLKMLAGADVSSQRKEDFLKNLNESKVKTIIIPSQVK